MFAAGEPIVAEAVNANFLALTLAHDINTDEKTVDQARQEYATTMIKKMMGADPEYTQTLQFTVPAGKQRDPDESIIIDALTEEIKQALDGD
jgi:hypothetical protein